MNHVNMYYDKYYHIMNRGQIKIILAPAKSRGVCDQGMVGVCVLRVEELFIGPSEKDYATNCFLVFWVLHRVEQPLCFDCQQAHVRF